MPAEIVTVGDGAEAVVMAERGVLLRADDPPEQFVLDLAGLPRGPVEGSEVPSQPPAHHFPDGIETAQPDQT